MLYHALAWLRNQLNAYLNDGNVVILGNVALTDTDAGDALNEHVVMTLVNLSEESTLKNGLHYRREAQSVTYQNAPVHLNLYLLFCANYRQGQGDTPYANSLRRLSSVMEFFQGQTVFTPTTNPDNVLNDLPDGDELRLIMELYSPTFEQVNHLWGALGGKQLPSVLYKCRLVRIQANRAQGSGPLIEEIQSDEAIR